MSYRRSTNICDLLVRTAFICILAFANAGGAWADPPAATAPAAMPPAAPAPSYTTTFDYTPLGPYGLPLVQVFLPNGVTATFALDTGTSSTVITRALALRLGLTPKPALKDGQPYTMYGKKLDTVTLPTVEVGNFTVPDVPVLVIDGDKISALAGQPFSGILGANVLSIFAVECDFPRHKITLFSPGGLTDALVRQSGFTPADALPLTSPPDSYAYSVPVRFRNGTRTDREDLRVDTGGAETDVSAALAARLGLMPTEAPHQDSTLERAFDVDTASVDSINLGGVEMLGHRVTYLSHATKGYYPPLLCMDVLGGYRVLMDFPAGKMYLAPPASLVPAIRVGPPALASTPPGVPAPRQP